eukprot:Gregarina_sp_Poly_1__7152@NODE_391_length_8961_cov_136_980886_g320_i0_p1_GENE_NODE_391_length_8961_cov_136_980886_g320_i0NODE_391_length_8961_cov_136_980886_g320_i0_p1_ORF_typecomplete_len1721_score396_04Filament/PF00038_21/2_1Filament/PF00038_21/69Filament/PF00038_21/69Filament/PF00038_21/1_7e06Filament/PF00038_21/3e02Filament/PF00038_21/1_8e03Filament/PF00038_21/0_071Filament/PF00038_21/1_9e02MAD/PF05557_13/0_0075MAD/PF05557_13/3_2e03MAD/PF05557_13/0_65MAD/PF05557_13/0_0075MAD/PF05557_13/0_27M
MSRPQIKKKNLLRKHRVNMSPLPSPGVRAATPSQSGISANSASNEAAQSTVRKPLANASPTSLLTSTVSTNITNVASPRRWSSSSGSQEIRESPATGDTPVPVGGERSKLGNVFSFFKSRTSSVTRTTVMEERKFQDTLSLARQQIDRLMAETASLRQQLENSTRELNIRQAQLEVLDGTNAHCQKLLKRNADLEMLIASIQDESDAELLELRRQLQRSNQLAAEREHDIAYLKDELAQKNKACCRDAISKEMARLKKMAEDLANKEDELARLQRDLQIARVELQSGAEKLELSKREIQLLREEKLSSYSSLSDVSEEMKRLLRESSGLEKQLAEMRHSKITGEEHLRKTIASMENDVSQKESEIGRLLAELTHIKQVAKEAEEQSQALAQENSSILARLRELESKLDNYSNLMSQLRESEEKRKLEQSHNEEILNRLKAQLASYKDVHQQAAELLLRNTELERTLDQHLKSLQVVDSNQVRDLRQQLREKDAKFSKLEARLSEEIKNAELNEKIIRDLNRKLQATEIAASQIYSAPLDAEKRATAIQEAVEAAVSQASADNERMITDLKRKYDILVGDIRKSHQSELEQKDRETDGRIRSAVAAKTRDFLKALQDKEEEWIQAQKARDSDFDRMCAEKEEEMKRYRAAFEASLVANYDSKLKQLAEDKNREVRELRERLEQKIREAQDEAEHQMRRMEKEHRNAVNAKDADIGRLSATVDTLSESYRMLESTMQDRVQEQAKEEANLMLVHKESALLEKLTNGQLDFERKRASMQAEMDSNIEKIRKEEKALRDALLKEKDDVQHQASQRIQDMQLSLDKLINTATGELASEIDSMRNKLANVTRERDDFRNRERELQMELNKLAGVIQERDAAVASLSKELNTSEAHYKKNMENLKAAMELQTASRGPHATPSSDWSSLVKRNSDLEQLVAEISEKQHDDLRQRHAEVTKLRRQLNQMEHKLSQSTRDNEDLKNELRRVSGRPSTNTESLTTQIRDLSSELAATQAEKARMSKELDRTKIRLSEAEQDLNRAFNGNPDRQNYHRDLIGKLSQLQELMAAIQRDGSELTGRDELAAAKHEAEQRRLAAEIDYLKRQMAARQQRIDLLEESLTKLQRDLMSDPTSTGSEQIKTKLRDVQKERNAFSEECKLLQEQLQKQASTLSHEIERRDAQLTSLKNTNERVSALLARNTDLELEVKNLFKGMKDKLRVPEFPNDVAHQTDLNLQHEISETLTVFEHEFHTRSQQYEADLRTLAKTVEDRDREIERLQNELRTLRNNLERVYNDEIESHRLSFEVEKNKLKRENENLKNSRLALETQLEKLRRDLSDAQAFDAERVDRMINELTHKMRDQQMMMAELQDEKDNEIRRIESKLESSRAAQRQLEQEIGRVSRDLAQKENEITDLSSDLHRLMKENEYLNAEAVGSAAASEEEWEKLMNTLEALFDKLVVSQSHANSLIMTLQALLKEQEESLEEMTRSQQAVSQARVRMSRLVNANDLPSDLGNLAGLKPGVFGDARRVQESMAQNHDYAQVAQMRASIESKQEALEKLKQKSQQRDEELANMRAKLTTLQLHEGLVQDLRNKDHDAALMTQEALAKILNADGELGSLNHGLETIQRDLEELKGLRRDIEGRKGLQKRTWEQATMVQRELVTRELGNESTVESITRTSTHETQYYSQSSPKAGSRLSSPAARISLASENNKRKITTGNDSEDNAKKIRF